MGRAGSRCVSPGWERCGRRRAGLISALEDLDDDHRAAAARAGWLGLGLVGRFLGRGRRDIEEAAGAFEMILAPGAGEQAIVADAVEPARQGVEEKAADELVGGERHDLLPSRTGLAIILVTEVICPLLSGPKLMIFWTTKEIRNAEQEASPGRDYRQAA